MINLILKKKKIINQIQTAAKKFLLENLGDIARQDNISNTFKTDKNGVQVLTNFTSDSDNFDINVHTQKSAYLRDTVYLKNIELLSGLSREIRKGLNDIL